MLRLVKLLFGGAAACGAIYLSIGLVASLLGHDGSARATADTGANLAAASIYALFAIWLINSAMRKPTVRRGVHHDDEDVPQSSDG